MEDSKKRKTETSLGDSANKKLKGPKQWRVPRRSENKSPSTTPGLESGDAGIWITCDMHKEGKCTAELRDLFQQYADKLYSEVIEDDEDEGEGEPKTDIEADIKDEIEGLQKSTAKSLFQPIKIDVKCVLFFRTRPPVEPVSFVHQICTDALHSSGTKKSRWIKRLTPVTLIGKATEKGLAEVTQVVLGPHFHQKNNPMQKFAIRTTIRNHTTLSRDVVIKQVADAVGRPHSVDLVNYDLLILVEIYKNFCGMSVVQGDFDALKRYNLAELYDPNINNNDNNASKDAT